MRNNSYGYGSTLNGGLSNEDHWRLAKAQQAASATEPYADVVSENTRASALDEIQRRLSALYDQLGYSLETATCVANRTLGTMPEQAAPGTPQPVSPNGAVEAIHCMIDEIYNRANRLGDVVNRLERLG